MEAAFAVSGTRLAVLKNLAKGPCTPTELSERLGRSLPTVTRHLASLEGLGLVEKMGEERGRTRPYAKYRIRESLVLLKVMEGDVGVVHLTLTEDVKAQIRVWSIPQREFHYYVERFLWEIQDYLPQVEAVAVYGSVARGDAREGSDVDVLVLARGDVEEMKRRCEAMVVNRPGGESKMVMAQVLRPEEFEAAIRGGSSFAKEVAETMLPVFDPKGVLKGLE